MMFHDVDVDVDVVCCCRVKVRRWPVKVSRRPRVRCDQNPDPYLVSCSRSFLDSMLILC